MCEIYFIKTIGKKLEEYDIKQIGKMLESGGKLNKDGYGTTDGIKILKSEKPYVQKENFESLKRFIDSRFIIGHNRFTTTGKTKKINSHPFYNKRFIWVHNGIISNHVELTKTYSLDNILVDSQIIGEVLLKKTIEKPNVEIIVLLKEVLEEISGSLSVFLYDNLEKRLYYFKNSGTEFSFRLLENKTTNDLILVGSTNSDRLNLVYSAYQDKTTYGLKLDRFPVIAYFTPIDNIIYELTNESINILGNFKGKPYVITYTEYSYGNYGYKENKNFECGYSLEEIKTCFEAYFKLPVSLIKNKKGKKKKYLVIFESLDEINIQELKREILDLTGIDITRDLTFNELSQITDIIQFNTEYDNTRNNNLDGNDYYREW